MTDQHVQLVLGLTPMGPAIRWQITDTTAPRNRAVLLALAYLADDDGRVTASVADLSAFTQCKPAHIRAGVAANRDLGFITVHHSGAGPCQYQIQVDALRGRQGQTVLRNRAPIYHLADYGAPAQVLRKLDAEGIRDFAALADRIKLYRALPADLQQGFGAFLDIRALGELGAAKILTAYDAWLADDATTG
jgi:hypothetical protein